MRELGEDVHGRMGTVGCCEVGDEVMALREDDRQCQKRIAA